MQYSAPIYNVCIGSYPVERFEGIVSSETSFSFSWAHPTIGSHRTTSYTLMCLPLLSGITAPKALTLPPTVSSAVMTGLYPGVNYNCTIITITREGASHPPSLFLSTPEIGM